MYFASAGAAEQPAVKTVDDGQQIVMDNGVAGLTISKRSGDVTSIRMMVDGKPLELGNGRTAAMYFDYDGDNHHSHPVDAQLVKLVSASADSAEVSVGCDPRDRFPFHSEVHYMLRRGDSGFYVWIKFTHGPGMAAADFEQARTVIRAVPGTTLFTNYVVDDQRKGPFPTGPITETVQDTTWKYAADGLVHTKYDYCKFIADDLVHGLAGGGVGLWMIQPSREYVNGGPLRQELTVHQGPEAHEPQQNIVLWMFQGAHFGGPPISLAADQAWSRFYGPAMVYLNRGASIVAMWADAKQKGAAEEAAWPYAFVHDADYPLERGSVRGKIELAGGQSAQGAWVVLAPAREKDWCRSSVGYQFWTRADAAGRFEIGKVRPGSYALFFSGANQFEDYRLDDVRVAAGGNTDVGTQHWQPITHGRTLWQIGVADRSGREFKDGDNVRHYDNFIRYAKTFPDDVTFTIGKSKESEDWNFAQWGWYMKRPYWSVMFDEPRTLKGKATLTIGILSWDYPPGLDVSLNEQAIGSIKLPKSGAAVYRSAGQDSLYELIELPFDAGLIRAGSNELRLQMAHAVPFADPDDARPGKIGGVMYDAIRLEVDETAAANKTHRPS